MFNIIKYKKGLEEKDNKGFTLIELIVVVAIIGILTAIAIPVYGSIQTTTKKNAVASSVSNAYTSATALAAQGQSETQIKETISKMNSESKGDITLTFEYFQDTVHNPDTGTSTPTGLPRACVKGTWTRESDLNGATEGLYPDQAGQCGGSMGIEL